MDPEPQSPNRVQTTDFAPDSGVTDAFDNGQASPVPRPKRTLTIKVPRRQTGQHQTSSSGIRRASTGELWTAPDGSARSSASMVLGNPLYFPEFCDSIVDGISKRIGIQEDTEPDSFETHLRERVNSDILAHVYHSLHNRPAELFKDLYYFGIIGNYKTEQPISGLSTTTYDDTLSSIFTQTRALMENIESTSVRFCCITSDSPALIDAFDLTRLFFSTVPPQDRPFWFRVLSAHLLAWARFEEDGPRFVEILRAPLEESELNVVDLDLPSLRNVSTNGWQAFTFIWARVVLEFSTTKFHASFPYWDEPKLVRLKLMERTTTDGSHNVLIICNSDTLLGKFRIELESTVTSLGKADNPFLGACQIHFAIQRLMNNDLVLFLKDLHYRVRKRVLASRKSAGRASYLYVTVLEEDYAKAALRHLRIARSRFQAMDVHRYKAPEIYMKEKKRILKDTVFIEKQLDTTLTYLAECRDTIKGFAELTQTQTTGIVSIMVAVYVPFSFVCAYLGMNTTEILSGNIPTSNFWAAAVPLAFATILLPISPVVMRYTLTSPVTAPFTSKFLAPWRLHEVVDACLGILIVSVVIVHLIYWRLATDGLFVSYFRPLASFEPAIVDALLALLAGLKAAEHTVQRTYQARKWFFTFGAVSIVSLLCACLSALDKTPATLVTPICFFIFCVIMRPIVFGDKHILEKIGIKKKSQVDSEIKQRMVKAKKKWRGKTPAA